MSLCLRKKTIITRQSSTTQFNKWRLQCYVFRFLIRLTQLRHSGQPFVFIAVRRATGQDHVAAGQSSAPLFYVTGHSQLTPAVCKCRALSTRPTLLQTLAVMLHFQLLLLYSLLSARRHIAAIVTDSCSSLKCALRGELLCTLCTLC